MKFKDNFIKTTAFIALSVASLFMAPATIAAQPEIIKQVRIVNNSELTLKPTAEGFAQGCVGGSLPPFAEPVEPHTIRNINIHFIQYTNTCQFNILPQPHMMTYEEACHGVQPADTVVFSGSNSSTLQCQIS